MNSNNGMQSNASMPDNLPTTSSRLETGLASMIPEIRSLTSRARMSNAKKMIPSTKIPINCDALSPTMNLRDLC